MSGTKKGGATFSQKIMGKFGKAARINPAKRIVKRKIYVVDKDATGSIGVRKRREKKQIRTG